ncbi:hypothetical protein Deipr_2344 (plasmid) [Deinococcus proteolyticus MRP]|uniref:Uncharacterized protein n=1 Tax=Deinococcus proteolyticus (strain ATCC 35074 / DSM 20540 / JCM 6276 / NBRC 101906 / NCIMB 13154 / VKM Ac-1939 / CCM 2703 / MRP) TaxID=693977 RepID=F0RQA9_DEIPM|nr:hypothetical protein [Deinococcus proteolyticus]ADY27468.1 hypothetical protein Deipr_2344 [Deinococcus proteolyticus MRP]
MTVQLTRAKGGARGCGAGRQEGHIYIECGFPPEYPVEQFVTDLPIPIDTKKLGYCAQGITLIERQGVYHVVDIVGAGHYPCAADFIEEARQMGISRKIPRSAEFGKLTRESTLILIHPQAYLRNAAALAPYAKDFACPCGKGHSAHEPCAGWHWHLPNADHIDLTRKIPSGRYTVFPLRPGHDEPELSEALFMQVPISNLTVINNKNGQTNPQSLDIARRAALPVFTSHL